MKIEIISDVQQFEALQNEWNSLLVKSSSYSFFLTWEWLYYWWRHFGKHLELCILLLKDETTGQTLGIVPFCLERFKWFRFLTLRKIKFLGTEKVASDFLDFIIYPGKEAEVLEAVGVFLEKHNHLWDLVEISDVDEQSRTLDLLKKNTYLHFPLLKKSSLLCPYIQLPEMPETFFASLSPRMKRDIKSKGELLQQEHGIQFSIADDPAQLQANIGELFRLHNARFDYKSAKLNITSGFAGDQFKHFHEELAPRLLAQKWLRLNFLLVRQKAVACIYAFKFKNRLFAYQSGFDPEWSRLSVGSLLFNHMIQDSIREGLEEFHFLRGTETYKAKWTKTARRLWTTAWVNKNFRGHAYFYATYLKTFVKNLLAKLGWRKRLTDPDTLDHFPPVPAKPEA